MSTVKDVVDFLARGIRGGVGDAGFAIPPPEHQALQLGGELHRSRSLGELRDLAHAGR